MVIVSWAMPLFDYLPLDWKAFLEVERFSELERNIDRLYEQGGDKIFPSKDHVFRAFELCELEQVKVIILGQDPYFSPGQANGLAFSCETAGVMQPSLRNILAEVQRSMQHEITNRKIQRGDLEPWAEQGVLLLNAVLTVEARRARSHIGQGWEEFTSHVIDKLLSTKKHLVFMRWGKDAEALKLPHQARRNHLILTASHPSPYSYRLSFEGCDHFAEANQYLEKHGQTKIQWT